MRVLVFLALLAAPSLGAKLDGLAHHDDHHHDHHDHHDHHEHEFELATGEETKFALTRINELFSALFGSEDQEPTYPRDVPSMNELPADMRFSCDSRLPGYYADTDYQCQVFHMCVDGVRSSYLCPNATVFNQEIFACDWWYNVDCPRAQEFFILNEDLYKEPEKTEEEPVASDGLQKSFKFSDTPQEDPFAAVFQVPSTV